MFNIKIHVYYSVDYIKSMWHTFNHISELLPAHVTYGAGEIMSAVLTQCLKNYLKCAPSAFSHILVSDSDYRISSLFGDMCNHSRLQLSMWACANCMENSL